MYEVWNYFSVQNADPYLHTWLYSHKNMTYMTWISEAVMIYAWQATCSKRVGY